MPEPRDDGRKVHVTFGAPDELISRVDAYAADRGIARTAALRELCHTGVAAMLARGYEAASGNEPGGQDADADASDNQPASRNRPPADADYVTLVSARPRATMAEIAEALGVSRTTARGRMGALADAGRLSNAGSDRTPLWEVPGVKHTPEELLTRRQAAILRMLREEPGLGVVDLAAAVGHSEPYVRRHLKELERLGLAERVGAHGWQAVDGGVDGGGSNA